MSKRGNKSEVRRVEKSRIEELMNVRKRKTCRVKWREDGVRSREVVRSCRRREKRRGKRKK